MPDGALPRTDASAAPLSLRDRALSFRDRVYASDRFRRAAAAFPFTRWIARRRARALFDLVAGFVYSQTLYACVRLRLFETLSRGPRTATDLACACGLPAESMARLLDAAAALGLLQSRSGGRVGLGPLGASLVGSPGVAAMVDHHAIFYADLADPVSLLRDGPRAAGLAGFWPYARTNRPGGVQAGAAETYSALMSASQRMVADEILALRPFDGRRRLLDVGGGDGTFLRAVANSYPGLALALCDLPAVAAVARRRSGDAAIEIFDCDFKSQALPAGADAISLVRVLHDHDDAVVEALLKSCWRALPAGGRIVIVEPMCDARAAEPVGAAYFGFYLLAMGSGRPRRPAELAAMARAAGFSRIERPRTRLPLVASVIVATKQSDKLN